MPENLNDSYECLKRAISRLDDFICEYQRSQILVRTAFDYLLGDYPRVLDSRTLNDNACYLLTVYEELIERLDQEYEELSLEVNKALKRHKPIEPELKTTNKRSNRRRSDI